MSVAAAVVERARARRADAAWAVPAGLVVAILTWHLPWVIPHQGIDNSWALALTMAVRHGMDFGREIVFTYGPLGFLSQPLVASRVLAVVGWAFALAAQVAVAAVAVAAASRTFGRALGLVLAFVAVGLTLLVSDMLVYLTFFAAVWVLERDEPPAQPWLPAAGGVVAAVELLIKLNGGVLCLALSLLVAWRLGSRWWRSELAVLVSFAAGLVLLWVATRNSLSALPAWLRESRHVVGSYAYAMAIDPPGRQHDTIAAAVLVALALVLLLLHVRGLARPRAVALVAVAAGYTYAYLKEGFVRHDIHALYFFGAFAVALLAFAWRSPLLRAGAVVLVAGCAIGSTLTPYLTASRLYRPGDAVRGFETQARDLVSPDLAYARAGAQLWLGVPPHDVALLRGHTVDSIPYETSAVWAYRLRWRPEPLLQWYMAYDEQLDSMNAAAIASRGAARVLRQRVVGVDGTLIEFEAPATYVALLCHYRELAADGSWQVLARTGDRCGPPRRLATVTASSGEAVTVPAAPPGTMVVAHVHIPQPLRSRLAATILKQLTLPQISVGGNTYRLVSTTAGGPLVMRLPGVQSPFYGGYASYDSFTVLDVPSPITVEFDAIPIRGRAAPVAAAAPHTGAVHDSSLVVDGTTYRVVPGTFQGWVDVARAAGPLDAIAGWTLAPRVAVFADGRLVAVARTGQARGDVAGALGARALRSGYSVYFHGGAHVRVFAIGGGRASELSYPAGYAWP